MLLRNSLCSPFLSGLCCSKCDCSLSFPFPAFLLRCHNGHRPGLDGGEMVVIESTGSNRGVSHVRLCCVTREQQATALQENALR